LHKFKVTWGQEVFSSTSVSSVVQDVLRLRLKNPDSETDSFDLNNQTKQVIKQIHHNWRTLKDLKLPTDEPLLDDFDLSCQTMSEMDLEPMQEMFVNLALADSRLFLKVLEHSGFDIWLT